MGCTSEFLELASHNPFIQDLDDQGYDLDLINGYFIVFGVPYLDKDAALKHGELAFPVELANGVIDPPKNHQAWFRGDQPHDETQRALKLGAGAHAVTVADAFVTTYAFSLKLQDETGQNRDYSSFQEKVDTYLRIITGPAAAKYDDARPLKRIERKALEQGSPLRFPDTLSARYHMNDVSFRLRGKKVAIVGLGGTGSYILDFASRTHLEQIALFDDDKIHVHTMFRIPGFIPNALGNRKVDVLAEQYGNWHGGIKAFPERITPQNIENLRKFDFVFVSIDDGPSRRDIVEWLTSNNIPFVDCGMGLNRCQNGLNGAVRITGVDRAAFEQNVGTVCLPIEGPQADEYRKQAQIAELNALNGALAVIRFKQHFGLLERVETALCYTFETASFELDHWPQPT
jgi:molybdopterin/thiamine biosynthesis adenylyltransferase